MSFLTNIQVNTKDGGSFVVKNVMREVANTEGRTLYVIDQDLGAFNAYVVDADNVYVRSFVTQRLPENEMTLDVARSIVDRNDPEGNHCDSIERALDWADSHKKALEVIRRHEA